MLDSCGELIAWLRAARTKTGRPSLRRFCRSTCTVRRQGPCHDACSSLCAWCPPSAAAINILDLALSSLCRMDRELASPTRLYQIEDGEHDGCHGDKDASLPRLPRASDGYPTPDSITISPGKHGGKSILQATNRLCDECRGEGRDFEVRALRSVASDVVRPLASLVAIANRSGGRYPDSRRVAKSTALTCRASICA